MIQPGHVHSTRGLEISYKPVELRSCIERAVSDRLPVTVPNVQWPAETQPGGVASFLDVQAFPLFTAGGALPGTSITFADVTAYRKLQADLQAANFDLETAYEELQSTNEELETTNEELQSTNEELETMNEELQSTNEELLTLNEERSDEVNGYLESILGSMRGGVVVLDQNLLVQIWNHRAEDLWGLRTSEVLGNPLLNLDIGLPVEQLKQPIKLCLSGESEQSETILEATNRRGKTIRCRVACAPLRDASATLRGASQLMSEVDA